MRQLAKVTVVAVAVALVSGAAGCVKSQSAGPSYRPAEASLSDAAVELAIRAGPYRHDQNLLWQAEYELTRRCMSAQGFAYPRLQNVPSPYNDDPWLPDLVTRQRYGYGFTDADSSPGSQYPSQLSAANRVRYVRALVGDQQRRAKLQLSSGPEFTFATTGCIAESRKGIYGDVISAARVSYVPQEAYNTIYHHIADDPAMHQAMKRWAACMSNRGYPYKSMNAARADAHQKYNSGENGGTARRREIQISVSDGECALTVGIPQVVNNLGRQYVIELTPAQRDDLNYAAHARIAALGRARYVTSR